MAQQIFLTIASLILAETDTDCILSPEEYIASYPRDPHNIYYGHGCYLVAGFGIFIAMLLSGTGRSTDTQPTETQPTTTATTPTTATTTTTPTTSTTSTSTTATTTVTTTTITPPPSS